MLTALAGGSIAIAEAQSYAYEALRSIACLERDLGGSVRGPFAFAEDLACSGLDGLIMERERQRRSVDKTLEALVEIPVFLKVS